MRVLYVFGSGGMGRELADIVSCNKEYDTLVFVDDISKEQTINGFKKISSKELFAIGSGDIIVGLGEPAYRESFTEQFSEKGFNIVSVSDLSSDVSSFSEIGKGTIIHKGVKVTCNSRIGKGCLLNINSSVSHDCEIGNYCVLSPAATVCGAVRIGNNTFLGAGSVVKDHTKIGSNCIVGAGSIVISDVPDNCVVVGNPAKTIRKNDTKRVF